MPEVERLAAALGTTPQDLIIARAERTDALAAPGDSSDGYAIQDAASGAIILNGECLAEVVTAIR